MNSWLRRTLLVSAAASSLLLGPLGAQESDPKPAPESPPAEEPAAPADAADEEGAPPAGSEENVSADNSLSFPVDI